MYCWYNDIEETNPWVLYRDPAYRISRRHLRQIVIPCACRMIPAEMASPAMSINTFRVLHGRFRLEWTQMAEMRRFGDVSWIEACAHDLQPVCFVGELVDLLSTSSFLPFFFA